MCGIAGFVSSGPEQQRAPAVRLMTDCLIARGPDALGAWSSDGVSLGHRRLSILDPQSRADQPMVSSDGRHAIVFNGEIYNYRALRDVLESRGVRLRTTSDTEVLLELYKTDGAAMLPRLRGMFAFAIWDSSVRELFMARDPYGIKPLYFARTDDGVLFASQVKALLASGRVSTRRDPAAVAGFYLWGSVPEPLTLFRDIEVLPAGHCMRVQQGVPSDVVRWSDIAEHWRPRQSPLAASELSALVSQSLADSVKAHLVADVPVSVFLSGGVDSATVAALAADSGANLDGITVGFEEFAGRPEDEATDAALVAAHYGFRHRLHVVSEAEFRHDLPRILKAMDQPSVDGVNTWFASKAAAQAGFKVVLSGIGGDELFRGYSLFGQIPRAVAIGRALAAMPGGRALVVAACLPLARAGAQPKLASLHAYMNSIEGMYFLRRGLFMPRELPGLMGAAAAAEGLARLAAVTQCRWRTGLDGGAEVGVLESTYYLRNQLLRDSDWASMAHSVELRTPFVDIRLLEALGPHTSGFAGRAGKMMIAHAPRKPLPDALLRRRKTGFGVPMEEWLSSMPGNALVPMKREPWARRWARTVLAEMPGCE